MWGERESPCRFIDKVIFCAPARNCADCGRRASRAVARNYCEEFAPRNGTARASGGRGANRVFEIAAGGSRWRGKCVKNLLPETEPQGLAGKGEQTAPGKSRPAPFAYRKPPPHAGPEGPSHFRRAHPTFGGPQQKNAGRPPGVFPYPINPVILTIPTDSGRFPRILPGTLSAMEALLRRPLRGWLPRSAEAPDRAGTSAGGTNRCGRSDRN